MGLQWQCGMLLEDTDMQEGIDLGSCMHLQMQPVSQHFPRTSRRRAAANA